MHLRDTAWQGCLLRSLAACTSDLFRGQLVFGREARRAVNETRHCVFWNPLMCELRLGIGVAVAKGAPALDFTRLIG
jgi:hypothetical protein